MAESGQCQSMDAGTFPRTDLRKGEARRDRNTDDATHYVPRTAGKAGCAFRYTTRRIDFPQPIRQRNIAGLMTDRTEGGPAFRFAPRLPCEPCPAPDQRTVLRPASQRLCVPSPNDAALRRPCTAATRKMHGRTERREAVAGTGRRERHFRNSPSRPSQISLSGSGDRPKRHPDRTR